MKKYDLSKIMTRAWELVKKVGMTISAGLKKAWKEAKETAESLLDTLIANLEEMAHSHYRIHAGMDRQVTANRWRKNGKDRTYLDIKCYTLGGRFKRTYKAGYINNATGEYVAGKYDDVDALAKEYIGK